jgi:hypothetical protein
MMQKVVNMKGRAENAMRIDLFVGQATSLTFNLNSVK